jgi:acetyl esterase/lipase
MVAMDAVHVDPELAPLLAEMPPVALSTESLPALRDARKALFDSMAPALSDAVDRTDHVIGTDPGVLVRVHRPKGASAALPCVVSMHGGGYVLGTLDMDDLRFDRYCAKFGCVAVSVEYRLAPETPYPGPLDDCYAALQWTHRHASELGVDPNRIGVAGISAGGGLAAALALRARDRGEVPVAFALLECPMLDDRQITSSSQRDGLAVWSRESNAFGWTSYLGERYGSDDIPGDAVPARAASLAGLPPTFVITGGADGFRDENIEYALRLNQSGVPTELHVLPGAPHGVQMFVGTRLARRWDELVTDWLGHQLRA